MLPLEQSAACAAQEFKQAGNAALLCVGFHTGHYTIFIGTFYLTKQYIDLRAAYWNQFKSSHDFSSALLEWLTEFAP